MTTKYPTPAQKAAGYVQTRDLTNRQIVQASAKCVAAWMRKQPKVQRALEDMQIFGSGMYVVTTEDATAAIDDVGRYLPRLP